MGSHERVRESEAVTDGGAGRQDAGAGAEWERAREAAACLAQRMGLAEGSVAVVLGSGWVPAADALGAPAATLAYREVPGFPRIGVAGHVGEARRYDIGGRAALVLCGRVHGYEGHRPATVVHSVRAAVLAGCGTVVLTNAAGAIAPLLPGTLVAIADHLNLTGRSPLAGPEPPAPFPSRFVDLVGLYDRELRGVARASGVEAEGVYAGLSGPHYETPAEVAMLKAFGADLVGMSTVWEAIAARHLAASVLGLSLVTNAAAGTADAGVTHGEVVEVGRRRARDLGRVLASILEAR